ncbi:MAG TPA: DUF484 family protein [Acetobacteraceae bacterium]|nr:DUF484 family protein [Acetobacteraceae bacterium]
MALAPKPTPGTTPGLDPGDVAAFLRSHPHFLADRPDLYRWLVPPARVHGEHVADHMAAMLRAERAHAAEMTARADGVLAAGRAAASLAARVQEAVLALLRASDPVDCAVGELPPLLAVDAVALCIEALRPGARPLPSGTVAAVLGGRNVVFRAEIASIDPMQACLLHGEAVALAHHDAVIGLPGEGPPALLALAARDSAALDPAQGAGALAFLGRAMAAALGR